ncbi:MAG: YceI family protein [Candidatus Cybelea sp.]
MTKSLCMLLLSAMLIGAAPVGREIDTAESNAKFSVAHIWVERVVGTVPIVSGSVTLDAGSMIPVSAAAALDATRIKTDAPDRDRSLMSPDFFDSSKFPKWTFVSTRIVPKTATSFEMDGNLTIHGVTQPEELNVTAAGTAAQPTYHAEAEIDRHAFGMARTQLDPTIGNTAEITLNIVLK